MYNSKITGLGYFVPENVVTNDDLKQWMETSDEWIQERTGIKERRWIDPATGETTSTMAVKASRIAIERAGLTKDDIDFIVFATLSPDMYFPGGGVRVQDMLDMPTIGALDVRNQCSGFIYSLSVADQFIKTGMYKHVLVIGADTFSTITDWTRRDSVFFGDGAGALVISETNEDKGFIDFLLHSDGTGKDHFTIMAGGSEEPSSSESIKFKKHFFKMNGPEVFKTAVDVVPKSIMNLLNKNNYKIDDIKCLLPHQPSIGILKKIAEKIEMPFEKVKTNMDRYANTSGATIPIILDETRKNDGFQAGDIVLFAAVGAGWTWGSALYKW